MCNGPPDKRPAVKVNGPTDLKIKKPSASCQEYLYLLSSDPGIEHAYQTLLDNFHLPNWNRPLKTLLVTSTQPEEGKTTVTVMLALTAMMAGKRVLLIDADLRKPKVHERLHLDNNVGLGDFLAGQVGVHDAIQAVEISPGSSDGIARSLRVITSGSAPTTNTLLSMGTPKLKGLIEELAPQFDFVFLDSSPVLAVTDPLFIAPMVDGIILIAAVGLVTEKDAKQAKERLEQSGGRILGVVMNRFNEKLHGAGSHPYYQSYYVNDPPGR
jgi:capsular exopolysaccharide synthesis family protein